MSDPTAGSEPTVEEPEVGRFSLWFLRLLFVAAVLVVFGFLGQAILSLLDDDGDGGDETIADLLATTSTTTEAPRSTTTEAPDSVEDDSSDDADPQEPTDDGSADEAEPPAVDPEPPAGDAEVQAFVDEAIAFIERERGQPFLETPVVEIIDAEEFNDIIRAEVEEAFAEDPDEILAGQTIERALALIGPDQTLEEVYLRSLEGGALGVYFPETDRLLIRRGAGLDLGVKATIVHELTHAYDDQRFDLTRLFDTDTTTEDGFVSLAIIEGSAQYLEGRWLDEQGPDARTEAQLASVARADLSILAELDISYILLEAAPYTYGEAFVIQVIDRDGIEGLDALFDAPSGTSEQIIEPLGAADLDPITVPTPEVDGEVLWTGAGGLALIDALFVGTAVSDPEASRGWGGDVLVAYLDDGQSCVRWDIATDSAQDQAELVAGFAAWTRARGGTVSEVGDLVRLDRCA